MPFTLQKKKWRLDLGERSISLDHRGEEAFVSHAHLDHAFSFKNVKKVIASDATLDLLAVRGRPCNAERSNSVELLRAGHVLGAKQLRAEKDGFVSAYAPDFKLSDSLTVRGAEVKECDELVVDATFADRDFPDRHETFQEISDWAVREQEKGRIVVLGGYAVGKAQELVACLNEYAGNAPLVSGLVADACKVYEDHGVHLGFIPVDSEEGGEALKQTFCAVVPMNQVNAGLVWRLQELYHKPVSLAVATGWALSRRYSVKAFALSDHAGKTELREFVERTGAKKVFTEKGKQLLV